MSDPSTSGGVTLALFLGFSTIFGLGYLVAVMRRANDDYKKTKHSLPGLRKDFWKAWWAMVKIGFWVFIGTLLLITWFVHDVRTTEQPHPEVSVTEK